MGFRSRTSPAASGSCLWSSIFFWEFSAAWRWPWPRWESSIRWMAILERRREIGVLKALGASDPDIRKLFFAEAGAMGLLGGIFGVLLGWLIGRALTLGTNFDLARRDLP